MKFTFAIAAGLLLGILGTNIFPVRSLEAKNPTSNANSTELHLGVGGLTENRIDACWVLEKKDGQKRLALYRMVPAGKNGLAIKFESVRQLDWDLKYVERNTTDPTVKKIKAEWDKAQKQAKKT